MAIGVGKKPLIEYFYPDEPKAEYYLPYSITPRRSAPVDKDSLFAQRMPPRPPLSSEMM